MSRKPAATWEELFADTDGVIKEVITTSDRAAAITAVAILDDMIHTLLTNRLADPRNARTEFLKNAGGDFSVRIELCFLLGLISNAEHADLHAFRKIRNDFAHARHRVSFSDASISDRLRALRLASAFWTRSQATPADAKTWFISGWFFLADSLIHRGRKIRRCRTPSDRSFMTRKPVFGGSFPAITTRRS